MADVKSPVQIYATWLLETVDWGRARSVADPDIFAALLEMLRIAAVEGSAADAVVDEEAAESG